MGRKEGYGVGVMPMPLALIYCALTLSYMGVGNYFLINFQPFWKGRGDFWGMGKVGITIAPKN